MAAHTDSALRHFGKVMLVFAVVGVVYSLGLIPVCRMRPESFWATLGPRADSLNACLGEGWRNVLYQPLFWLTTGVVFAFYDRLTGEIDRSRETAAS